jgi:rRNA maturation protein Nop10
MRSKFSLHPSNKDLIMKKSDKDEEKLPPHWERVHGAIWLIGIAILAWQGWWWPGILILVAISGLTQAALMAYVKRNQEVEILASEREVHLPETCPNCGGPLNASTIRWKGKQSATCPYCGSTVKAIVTTPA